MQHPHTGPDEETTQSSRPAQLVADTTSRLPRAPLTPPVRAGLWALRIFVLIITAMVIYTFLTRLN